ncbi:MAG: transposase [Chloroflexota bacterium]
MKLTAQIQLQPTEKQHKRLKETLERANAACNTISDYAWAQQIFNQFALHKALYYSVRADTALTAQLVVRCLSKVADAYKTDKDAKRHFKEHGAIAYDHKILKYHTDQQTVSIWTLPGREVIPYVCGAHQRELLKHQHGESDLVYHRGKWYLLAVCEIKEPEPDEMDGWLGVDRGVVNVAVASDGNIYTGARVEDRRQRYTRQRRALQKRNTHPSHRRLKKTNGKQSRFQKDVNHCTAKELVKTAKRTKQGIALENLKGINLRTRVRHEDRAKRGNWSFDQLGQYLEYKAALYGVPFTEVNPRYTSQRCAECGHTEKANRRSQSEFLCCKCGHIAHADINAARNISWVAVNQPIVPDVPRRSGRRKGTSPAL